MSDLNKIRAPLCICPACDKVFGSMRSLFGHHGRSHQTAINQSRIKYGCPFTHPDVTKDVKGSDLAQKFDSIADLESHLAENFPGCTLTYNLTNNAGNVASAKKEKPSPAKRCGNSSVVAAKELTPSPQQNESPPKQRRTPRIIPTAEESVCPVVSASVGAKKKKKPAGGSNAKQVHAFPICRCPVQSCPKQFNKPSGLFGHFGRVHSGQLDDISLPFEWKDVTYLCPFCPQTSDGSTVFNSIEDIEQHTQEMHSNCYITRPSALRLPGEAVKKRVTPTNSVQKFDLPTENEWDGGRRKSSRCRKPVDTSSMMLEDETAHSLVQPQSGYPAHLADPLPSKAKTLYKCPACDRTNLSKHGLAAHYGMKHGPGKVDWTTVEEVQVRSKKKPAGTTSGYRTGNWTQEEHDAFLRGHAKWTKISAEFVPTRDPKQVGSHALNYLTNMGTWSSHWNNNHSAVEMSPATRRGGRDTKKSPRGRAYDPAMELDGDGFDRSDSESDGEDSDLPASKRTRRCSVDDEGSDDGNSDHCIVCFEGGNIVCCSKCPRAYHPKCMAKDGQTSVPEGDLDLIPDDWQCNRCVRDLFVNAGEEIMLYESGSKKVRMAYSDFRDCDDFRECSCMLSAVADILGKLMNYDYGYVFSEPVDVQSVEDYLSIVEKPMDYSTVLKRLENGSYIDLISSDDVSDDDCERTVMEEILVHALEDVERVHHNCQLYNPPSSTLSRVAAVHKKKWQSYFNQYIDEKLPANVKRDLSRFRQECQLERAASASRPEGGLMDANKKAMQKQASGVLLAQKKRSFSISESESEGTDDIDVNDEDGPVEDVQVRRSKKARTDVVSNSSALLLLEDQVRALEFVFFSTASKLRAASPKNDIPAMALENQHSDHTTPRRGNLKSNDGSQLAQDPHAAATPDAAVSAAMPFKAYTCPPLPAEAIIKFPSGVEVIDVDAMSDYLGGRGNTVPLPAPACHESASSIQSYLQTEFQKQWYDRLEEIKQHKILHGTAIVSTADSEKLYHWRSRQRKRYHLTLHRLAHLKRSCLSDGDDKADAEWLLTLPDSMTGNFSIGGDGGIISDEDDEGTFIHTLTEKASDMYSRLLNDTKDDVAIVANINRLHQSKLYDVTRESHGARATLPFASRHSNSLFWDESLEELRFYNGANRTTVVPRNFPYNSCLPVWVEIQRARYLLQCTGISAGLTGCQVLVLGDELNFGDISSIPVTTSLLSPNVKSDAFKSNMTSKDATDKNSWSSRINHFKSWYFGLSDREKLKAPELLRQSNFALYSWCWRQCNASASLLNGTPSLQGTFVDTIKIGQLASSGFFRAFPTDEGRSGLVPEDDYDGRGAFDATFQVLEDFSVKYGSTVIPDWFECDRAFRMWVASLEEGMKCFTRGEPCILSTSQIERLILIGFCNDRPGLPNLSRSDVVFLKMLTELKRHKDLFGEAYASEDYPRLHRWIADQKELFRLSRGGERDLMHSSRLKMLFEAGLDFFTGECIPSKAEDLAEFQRLVAAPAETFPGSGVHLRMSPLDGNDNYWREHGTQEKFVRFKEVFGHSLVLASDDADVYWWFVEKRGLLLLSEMKQLRSEPSSKAELRSNSILRYLVSETNAAGPDAVPGGDAISLDHSMFVWLHYCERLMLFKAREGHCMIPSTYADSPLQNWLGKQQEMMYQYGEGNPVCLRPVQVKILCILGVGGKKRDAPRPKMSSRVLKMKYPLN